MFDIFFYFNQEFCWYDKGLTLIWSPADLEFEQIHFFDPFFCFILHEPILDLPCISMLQKNTVFQQIWSCYTNTFIELLNTNVMICSGDEENAADSGYGWRVIDDEFNDKHNNPESRKHRMSGKLRAHNWKQLVVQ